ncbi:DUF885 domain-containing protein [Aurantiacibacter spongiae]|uniref:DUF885 domain-containing protein n=1 Tax=Aurantiacibacter spongiae TaxID=2488860 RepID=A0A3N5D838_9SPHN|nr:DUF885 domain-containing protein [Aurantiacibacter spongiae]RPF70748.1 DUF885 domain-containing protein [Aurantiacibacter spongiae]
MKRLLTAGLLGLTALTPLSAHAQDWIERSNAYSGEVLEMQAEFAPENAAQVGLVQFDGVATELTADRTARRLAANEAEIARLQTALAGAEDANLRQDLEILIDSLEDENEYIRTADRLLIDWTDVPNMVFGNIGALLDDQVGADRRGSAADLLRAYAGLDGGEPLTAQARARFADSMGPGKVGPYRQQVEQAIDRVPQLITGIRDLFQRYQIDAPEALDTIETQLTDYAAWERKTVLPAARDDYRLPPELYALNLKQVGIDLPPQQLIARARRGFYETRQQMEALAPLVAAKFGFEETDYPSVIARLKADPVPQSELEDFYRDVGRQIEEIVAREHIVTLPDYPVSMRLGTEAENAASPAPHMRPPRLIGNTGEQGTFVLTTGDPSAGPGARFDDFNYPAAAWFVSAHEARPGHELQFAQMVARGVSQARILYAFNSVNVEGWALYAEAEILPFLPIEGQLTGLQSRLLRASRAMLDPMLNLGEIDVDRAREILSEEARFSDAAVKQELDRYTFRMPGQAGSYYYGYSQLIDLRIATELALGDAFDQQAFNDFLVGQGALPIELLTAAVEDEFIPAQRAAAAGG